MRSSEKQLRAPACHAPWQPAALPPLLGAPPPPPPPAPPPPPSPPLSGSCPRQNTSVSKARGGREREMGGEEGGWMEGRGGRR
eukprot:613504-Rhodomonas_salina.1